MGERTDGDCAEAFGDECRREIAAILRISDEPQFPEFWNTISDRGIAMRAKIRAMPSSFDIAPFDKSLTKRIEWLSRNVISPCNKLEEALLEQNLPNFAHWENGCQLEPEQIKHLRQSLNELKQSGLSLSGTLAAEIDQDISHNSEIKHDIVFNALADLHQYFPDLPLSRGNWDTEIGNMSGSIPDYVRRFYFEVTNQNDKLNVQIQDVISAQRKNQRTLS